MKKKNEKRRNGSKVLVTVVKTMENVGKIGKTSRKLWGKVCQVYAMGKSVENILRKVGKMCGKITRKHVCMNAFIICPGTVALITNYLLLGKGIKNSTKHYYHSKYL